MTTSESELQVDACHPKKKKVLGEVIIPFLKRNNKNSQGALATGVAIEL